MRAPRGAPARIRGAVLRRLGRSTVPRPRGAELAGQALSSAWYDEDLRGRLPDGGSKLLVVHVPKTGGTSLRQMLAAHVTREQTFLSTGRNDWVDRSVADLNTRTLFVGHSFLEPLYLLPDARWTTVLPVREPLSWWRSYYKYNRHRRRTWGQDHPMAELPFGAWIDSLSDEELANPQTSWLLGRARLSFDSPLVPPGRISATATALSHSPRQVLSLLEQLLQRIDVLGTTEDLLGMYLDACSAMGWEPQFDESRHDNVSSAGADVMGLTEAQRRRLRSAGRLDRYLYRRAREADRRRAAARTAPGRPGGVDLREPGPSPTIS